nr:reverse transcriptase domain-containing protein [Tanacetum cinerariifolium]
MSAMANTTPLVTTVTKPATNPRDADATPRVNIQEFCEEYYEDILPIIIDKVHRDRRKDVHTRTIESTRPLSYGDHHVLDRLGHRRQSAFDRLFETYSPSTTKSRPRGTDSRDHPRGRSHPHRLDTSNEDCPKDRERFRSVGESYDDSFSYSCRDGNRSRHMKRRTDNESPLSNVSKNDSSDGSSRRTRMPNNVKTYDGTRDPVDHVKIFQAAAQVKRWAMPTWCRMFNSTLIGAARVWFDEFPPESIDIYKDLKAAFLAYFMQQKKYVKDSVEIHNIKQKDGETIEDFMERFKVETGRMNEAPECMRISGFMYAMNNPELTKCLNEHVPKTMEEMMITTTAFIRGEAATASKKKGHTSWKAQDQSKRKTSDKRSDFRGHSREGRGSNRFTPLTRTPKDILAAEAGKFQPPPPMVTPVEKRSSNKFCKLSHLIKEIKHGRDHSKTGKKETPAEDKLTAIYMIQSWQRMTRQKVTQSFERVKEITFPPLTASSGKEGPLVIEAEMNGHMIHRMYVDGGSSMEILYEHCFNRLRPEIKNQMVPATTSLTGFSGETIWPLGQLRLLVTIGDADHSTRARMNFMIVRSLSPYNGIIRIPGIKEIQAVPSTAHGMLKFPIEGGIVTIRSTILIPTECTSVITSSAVSKEERTRLDNFKVALHPDFPDQEVTIEGTLSEKGRTELCSILKKNLDIFVWQPSDMTGVPRSVAEHRLNIQEGYSPVRQKKRGQAPERAKAIQAEVQKLVDEWIMREVYYHDWLSNPVMIKKHDGIWRMCVDFTNLNKACPQDCYPLPDIDRKVESLCGYPFKCFLDAYKGYHQIQLAESDEEKTAFHTGQGSYTEAEMLRDINEMFRALRKINMKLNPKKCTFGVAEGVFLGYVVTPDGIKPCPDKTTAVLQLPSPRTIKEVKSLNGKLASLNRFLSKSAEKSSSLFKTLKKCIKKSHFHWTAEAEQAFNQLKQHLSELPLLVAPKPKEELIIYLSATYRANREHNITYRPRTSVKGQILADFLTEMPDKNPLATPVAETQQESWTLFTDGSSCVDGSGAGLILINPEGTEFTYMLRFQFAASNNEAEYEALIAGLRIAAGKHGQVPGQSQRLGQRIHQLFDKPSTTKQKQKADALSKIASTSFAHLSKQVLVEILKDKHIKKKEVTTVVEEDGPTWMTPIVEYLKEGILPSDRKEARKLRNKARRWPFPKGPGKVKFLIFAMDYFTKWIEAKAVATITCGQVKKFLWDNIVCRFGLPGEIVSDNDKQFSDNPFKDWCDKLNITQRFASVKHPQSNGLVERANRSFGEGINAQIGMPTYRTAAVDVVYNDEELRVNLDLLEERRERVAIREAKAKLKMTKYYNARVRGVTFRPGDFVYRSNDDSHAVAGGNLGPK